ncbi:unnamed protein product [Rhizophagus irregularis]|nr:unnamed protein product [Rhizophagus irregularis]
MDDNELNDDFYEYRDYRNVESIEESLSGQQQQTKKSKGTPWRSSPLPALGWHFGRSYIHILNSAQVPS